MKKFPQWINQFLVYLQLNEIKGKYRFYLLTAKLFKNFVIKHQVGKQSFYVPYDQWCFWKNYGPNNYYLDEMLPFVELINHHMASFDFIDLGADIGTVSALVRKHCRDLRNIVAIEPNPFSFNILQNNFSENAILFNCAVSNFEGQCQFNFHQNQSSDHEGYIDPSSAGNTDVIQLDSLLKKGINFSKNIVIKIDVEGQELAVFSGAKNMIKNAEKVIVLLELHPETLMRDKLQPEDIFQEAEKLSNVEWIIPLNNNQVIDRSTPFFQQVKYQQYDVIGIMKN